MQSAACAVYWMVLDGGDPPRRRHRRAREFQDRQRLLRGSLNPETDRLKLARQLLLSLGVLTVGFFTWYAMAPENTALQAIFELFKIGVLPLVTLIVSFYFSRTDQ